MHIITIESERERETKRKITNARVVKDLIPMQFQTDTDTQIHSEKWKKNKRQYRAQSTPNRFRTITLHRFSVDFVIVAVVAIIIGIVFKLKLTNNKR